jgi:hypothetical protein
VLHRREYALTPVAQGRYLAEHISGAKVVELEGADSSLTFGETERALDVIEEFLTGVRRHRSTDRVLATVLLTDIVDSTSRAADLGDRRWRELLDRHDAVVRDEIDRARGHLWKTTGDGVLATFDAPGRAIRCAMTIGEALGQMGLTIRAGLHAGEVELRHNDIGGIAVHTAARVAALADPDEVLVSRLSPISWPAPTSGSQTAVPTRSEESRASGTSSLPASDPRANGESALLIRAHSNPDVQGLMGGLAISAGSEYHRPRLLRLRLDRRRFAEPSDSASPRVSVRLPAFTSSGR